MSESLPYSDSLSVSGLVRVYRCPRQYYFSRHETIPVSDRYHICKQVSLREPGQTNEKILWDEINLIHPEIRQEMQDYLAECLTMVSRMPEVTFTETDLRIRSEKLGIHGIIDKYDAQSPHISVVRCTGAPAAGCWPDDRFRLTAYQICLKETTGINVTGGYVEYIPDGIVRYYEPQPRDRRTLIQTVKTARTIEKGGLPERPARAPCKKCRYYEQCNPQKVRRLSDLLFKKSQ